MSRLLLVALLLGLCSVPTPGLALDAAALDALRGACAGDAFRYCSALSLANASVGRYHGVTKCFRVNKALLSAECSATIGKHVR